MDLFDLHCDTIVLWKEKNLGFDSEETHFSLREREKLGRMCQTNGSVCAGFYSWRSSKRIC